MNDPVAIEDLPVLDDQYFVGVDPKYLKMTYMPILVVQAIVIVAAMAGAALVHPAILIPGGALVVSLGGALVLRKLAFPNLGYQVRERDFSIRYGLIGRTVTTIPFCRIQNSLVSQSASERAFGLASLTVSSARGSISLPGLSFGDANKLREFVAMSASLDGEEGHDGA